MDEIILSETCRCKLVIEKKEETIYSVDTQDIEDKKEAKPEEDGNVKWKTYGKQEGWILKKGSINDVPAL